MTKRQNTMRSSAFAVFQNVFEFCARVCVCVPVFYACSRNSFNHFPLSRCVHVHSCKQAARFLPVNPYKYIRRTNKKFCSCSPGIICVHSPVLRTHKARERESVCSATTTQCKHFSSICTGPNVALSHCSLLKLLSLRSHVVALIFAYIFVLLSSLSRFRLCHCYRTALFPRFCHCGFGLQRHSHTAPCSHRRRWA